MKKLLKKLKDTWKMLGRPIYTGERLKDSLRALTYVSIFTAILGLALVILNLVHGPYSMLPASGATLVFGIGCAISAGIFKKREVAIIFPTLFCMVAFTMYTINGSGSGTAILWSLLLPIGISYFVSVRYGIILSLYYIIFFSVMFFTPLKEYIKDYYSDVFIIRFYLLYISMAGFTAISMIQYHRSVLTEIDYTDKLNKEVERQTKIAKERAKMLENLSEEMIQTLAVTIDAKDRYTNGHSFRVSHYCAALAEELGWSGDEVFAITHEALLHDIGKIGVPDQVLNKPGKLTSEEFEVIKSHTTIGGEILSRSEKLGQAADVARYHHERYDGAGYPSGLAGKNIPARARVVAIADAYDAMHSDRIYRKGLPLDVIRKELVEGRGKQFDPDYLDAFLRLFDSGELERVVERYADEDARMYGFRTE